MADAFRLPHVSSSARSLGQEGGREREGGVLSTQLLFVERGGVVPVFSQGFVG